MSKKRYYAVRLGHKTGVFLSWSECYYAIKGYSKPDFCAFYSLEEAKAFLADPNVKVTSGNEPIQHKPPFIKMKPSL